MTDKINLNQQIASVDREIAMRQRVYPSFVARGKMRQGEADYEIATMQAVKATLLWLNENETTIRAAVDAARST